ncbi:hypothetical protein [Erythrobacter sp. QSSC1-22B]|uniref:hypothetical protein n=1 Tax=Erythrobacter sp. QSSC1-22B TaxID=1860125 RepID=UPI00143BCF70|nr:hypothetical protein [Erythrobacter sp. QSSC1-22B]
MDEVLGIGLGSAQSYEVEQQIAHSVHLSELTFLDVGIEGAPRTTNLPFETNLAMHGLVDVFEVLWGQY